MVAAADDPESARLKRLGNESFVAKKFKEAIEFYTQALASDISNAVLYSNRSACYASLGEWPKAYEDAKICVEKDPKFIKGYYRLASAQLELGGYADAEDTLDEALKVEPGNDQVLKLRQVARNKKTQALAAAATKPTNAPVDEDLVARPVDQEKMKEIRELQKQTKTFEREIQIIQMGISNLERESRTIQVSSKFIDDLNESVPLYRSVGRAYFAAPKSEINERHGKELEGHAKKQKDFQDRQEFFQRRIASNASNIRDLTSQL